MIGIIGGSGVKLELESEKEMEIYTPFGAPSSKLRIGKLSGKEVAFLYRHGETHSIPPHKVNYRANIWALKSIGVKQIIALCAVGSLKEEMKPRDFVLVDQFIDRTNGREQSFYEGLKVCHISMGEPICINLRNQLLKLSQSLKIFTHAKGTYVCINGPRFSTKAESAMFKDWNGGVIGMTIVPECILAREAEICYACIAMVTDYDCWKDKVVTHHDVIKVMSDNVVDAKRLLRMAVEHLVLNEACPCQSALQGAFA